MVPLPPTCQLYGILDLGYVSIDDAPWMTEQLIRGGIDILQLRAKETSPLVIAELSAKLLPLAHAAKIPFLINDHPDVAALTAADGVHLGQDDGEIPSARDTIGIGRIVGRSTHSIEQAESAARDGADYIGFGPIHPTPTKPGRPAIGLDDIRALHEQVKIPIFCIGGIKRENLPEILAAGAKRVVIVSGILTAEDPAGYVADCRQLLREVTGA